MRKILLRFFLVLVTALVVAVIVLAQMFPVHAFNVGRFYDLFILALQTNSFPIDEPVGSIDDSNVFDGPVPDFPTHMDLAGLKEIARGEPTVESAEEFVIALAGIVERGSEFDDSMSTTRFVRNYAGFEINDDARLRFAADWAYADLMTSSTLLTDSHGWIRSQLIDSNDPNVTVDVEFVYRVNEVGAWNGSTFHWEYVMTSVTYYDGDGWRVVDWAQLDTDPWGTMNLDDSFVAQRIDLPGEGWRKISPVTTP